MIKSIIKGFSYNLGKFLFYFIILILLFLIFNMLDLEPKSLFLDVYATDNWGSYLNNDSIVYKHSYLSSADPPVQGTTACSELKWCSQQFYTGSLQTFYLSQYVERLKYGHTYYFSQTICSSNTNFQNVVANGIHVNFNIIGWNLQLSGIDVSQPNGSYSFRTCKKYIGSFDVTSSVSHTMGSADYIGIRYNRTNTSNYDIYVIESVLKDAGLNSAISSEITTSINNSISDVSGDIQVLNDKMTQLDNGINQVNNSIQQGNQTLNEINNTQKETNDLLKDDSVDTDGKADIIIQQTPNIGIESVITAPLSFIRDLATGSGVCSPINLSLPYNQGTLQIPCMQQYIKSNGNFNTFIVIYQSIILGITSYWVCINTYRIIKDMVNPEEDKLEVMDL